MPSRFAVAVFGFAAYVGSASAANAAPVTLYAVNVDHADSAGYFGPSLRRTSWRGPVVRRLVAGRYRIVLHDVSPDANFRLRGPGVNVTSTFEFVGTRSSMVRLRPGVYEYSRLGRENGQILPQPDGFQQRTFRIVARTLLHGVSTCAESKVKQLVFAFPAAFNRGRAPDIANGVAERYHGKGAATCAGPSPRLAVWSTGRG